MTSISFPAIALTRRFDVRCLTSRLVSSACVTLKVVSYCVHSPAFTSSMQDVWTSGWRLLAYVSFVVLKVCFHYITLLLAKCSYLKIKIVLICITMCGKYIYLLWIHLIRWHHMVLDLEDVFKVWILRRVISPAADICNISITKMTKNNMKN